MEYRVAFSLRGDLFKWLHYRGRFFVCQEKIGDLIGNYFGTTGSASGANGGFRRIGPVRCPGMGEEESVFFIPCGSPRSSNWGG